MESSNRVRQRRECAGKGVFADGRSGRIDPHPFGKDLVSKSLASNPSAMLSRRFADAVEVKPILAVWWIFGQVNRVKPPIKRLVSFF